MVRDSAAGAEKMGNLNLVCRAAAPLPEVAGTPTYLAPRMSIWVMDLGGCAPIHENSRKKVPDWAGWAGWADCLSNIK